MQKIHWGFLGRNISGMTIFKLLTLLKVENFLSYDIRLLRYPEFHFYLKIKCLKEGFCQKSVSKRITTKLTHIETTFFWRCSRWNLLRTNNPYLVTSLESEEKLFLIHYLQTIPLLRKFPRVAALERFRIKSSFSLEPSHHFARIAQISFYDRSRHSTLDQKMIRVWTVKTAENPTVNWGGACRVVEGKNFAFFIGSQ